MDEYNAWLSRFAPENQKDKNRVTAIELYGLAYK